MSELSDEEMPESFNFEPQMRTESSFTYWRPFIGIAASMLLIMSFAWLTGFGFSKDENGIQIGYQKIETGLSSEQVAELIAQERAKTLAEFSNMLSEGQDSLYNQMKVMEASFNDQPQFIYEAEKQELMDDMINLSEGLSENYRELMRQLIVNFSNNWQSQRIQDLQNIQTAFNDLEDATINNQLDIEDEIVRLSEKLDAVVANLNNNK